MGRRGGIGTLVVLVGGAFLCSARVVKLEMGGTFYSANRRYEFRVEDLRPHGQYGPPREKLILENEDDVPWHAEKLRGSLVRIRDGTETIIWRTYLPYAPHLVYVTNDGQYVVTAEIDAWDYRERGLQIFGPDGSLIHTYPGDFFAPRHEDGKISWSWYASSGYETWHDSYDTGFTRDQRRFVVALHRGGTARYRDPKTGEMITIPPPSYAESLRVFDLATGDLIPAAAEDDPLFQHGMGAVWVDMLSSGDAQERLEAARGIAHRLRRFDSSWYWPSSRKNEWDAYTLPALLEHATDADLSVRAEVIRGIYRIKSDQAIPIVRDWARAPEPELRRTAAELLMRSYDRKSLSLLVSLLQDSDEAVAKTARTHLRNAALETSRKNNSGVELLCDCMTEHGYPIEESERNIQLLIDVANTAACAGSSIGEASAIRRAARDLAREIGVLESY